MAGIIRMTGKKFLENFCEKFNVDDFNVILVSKDITTKDKYKNVCEGTVIMPDNETLSGKINSGSNEFAKRYMNQLKSEASQIFMAALVKGVIKDNINVVLLCSETENEFGYLDLFCEYIEESYKLDTYDYKTFKKKSEKIMNTPVKNVEEVEKILIKKIGKVNNEVVSLDGEKSKKKKKEKALRKELKEIVKEMKKKKIYKALTEFSDLEDSLDNYDKSDMVEIMGMFLDSLSMKQLEKVKKFIK